MNPAHWQHKHWISWRYHNCVRWYPCTCHCRKTECWRTIRLPHSPLRPRILFWSTSLQWYRVGGTHLFLFRFRGQQEVNNFGLQRFVLLVHWLWQCQLTAKLSKALLRTYRLTTYRCGALHAGQYFSTWSEPGQGKLNKWEVAFLLILWCNLKSSEKKKVLPCHAKWKPPSKSNPQQG